MYENSVKIGAKIDICVANDYCYRWSCAEGHMNIVLYLEELGAPHDIHADNDFAFRRACKGGYLEIAKHLIERDVDPHAMNDVAFKLGSQHVSVLLYFVEELDTQYYMALILNTNNVKAAKMVNENSLICNFVIEKGFIVLEYTVDNYIFK